MAKCNQLTPLPCKGLTDRKQTGASDSVNMTLQLAVC